MTHIFCYCLALAGCLFWNHATAITVNHPGDSVSFYIETYGEILPIKDAKVQRAHRVFERVRAVADKSSKRLPQLVVVNSQADPWALALPDGHIVLSRRAVDICHRQADATDAEARLAFVLGHELAHLAHDDFLHREVFEFIAKRPDSQSIARDSRKKQSKAFERELVADDAGFIYAAMAGYPVDRLVRKTKNRPQFFEYWIGQTHRRKNGNHPEMKKRAQLLLRRLDDLADKIVLFDYGVRLSHFDYCDDAVYFLHAFQKTFPGREVLNNLGYCYLQIARQEMQPERAFFYWMPLLLDGETRARFLLHRGGSPIKTLKQAAGGAALGYLREAEDYLKRASAADSGYLPARINLAVTYLYLGRPHSARSILAEARATAPGNPEVEILDALALYEQTEAGLDLWPAAVAKLEKVATEPDAPESALFNLARLLAARPRPKQAQNYWNRLTADVERLPDPIRWIVCREQSTVKSESCQQTGPTDRSAPGEWPLLPSTLSQLTKNVRKTQLGGWKTIRFDWFIENLHGHIFQRPDGKAEVLELDNFVQMQVLKGGVPGLTVSLKDFCDRPLRGRQLAHGELISCDSWAALLKGGEVKELWSIQN